MAKQIVGEDLNTIGELLQKVLGKSNYTEIERMGGLTNRTYRVEFSDGERYVAVSYTHLSILFSAAGAFLLVYGLFFYSRPSLKRIALFVGCGVLFQLPLLYTCLLYTSHSIYEVTPEKWLKDRDALCVNAYRRTVELVNECLSGDAALCERAEREEYRARLLLQIERLAHLLVNTEKMRGRCV